MANEQTLETALRTKYNIYEHLFAEGRFTRLVADTRNLSQQFSIGIGGSCLVLATITVSNDKADYELVRFTPLSCVALMLSNDENIVRLVVTGVEYKVAHCYELLQHQKQATIYTAFSEQVHVLHRKRYWDALLEQRLMSRVTYNTEPGSGGDYKSSSAMRMPELFTYASKVCQCFKPARFANPLVFSSSHHMRGWSLSMSSLAYPGAGDRWCNPFIAYTGGSDDRWRTPSVASPCGADDAKCVQPERSSRRHSMNCIHARFTTPSGTDLQRLVTYYPDSHACALEEPGSSSKSITWSLSESTWSLPASASNSGAQHACIDRDARAPEDSTSPRDSVCTSDADVRGNVKGGFKTSNVDARGTVKKGIWCKVKSLFTCSCWRR